MKKTEDYDEEENPVSSEGAKKKQKPGTPNFRDKLIKSMAEEVEKICKDRGLSPDKSLIKSHVESTIDNYVEDWYEISLEAMDLMEGRADFVTDDEINDPDIIKEAKLRVIKSMYDERPPGIHEHVAQQIIREQAAKAAT